MLSAFVAVLALAVTLLFWCGTLARLRWPIYACDAGSRVPVSGISSINIQLWLRRVFTFWNGKGITHLTFRQYTCFLYDIYTKPINKVAIRAYNQYGRVYGSYQGLAPTLVVGDPDILREVMVTKFKNFSDRSLSQFLGSDVWKMLLMNLSGQEWKKTRAIYSPEFTTTRLKTILVKVKTVAGKMALRVKEAAAKGELVDFSRLATNTAIDTMAALNYSIDIDSEKDTNHPIIKSLESLTMASGGWKLVMMFFMPTLCKILTPDYPPKSSTDSFQEFLSVLIEERKSKNQENDDFLQTFMNADYNLEDNKMKKPESAQKRKLTLEEITAQMLTFFVAGVESVSTVLSTTTYHLALNPECQDRAIAEVDKATSKGEITYDSLQEMPYLEACFKEAMRLCTPESVITRLCTEETTVAGIHFKPGMGVDIAMAGIHHDPENFPEPEKFNAERFIPENKDSIKPFTYLPFGAGPRNCVGMRLALVQAKTTLASMLQHVRFETCPETMIPLKLKPGQIVPFFDGPLILRAVLRQTSSSSVS